jgi:hypothetical protein
MKISCNIIRDYSTIPELSIQKQYLKLLRELES